MEKTRTMINIRKSDQDLTEYFQSVFNQCDKNKDGYVCIKELKEYLEQHEDFEIPDDVMEVLHSEFDRNKDKQMDLDEFVNMISHDIFKKTFRETANRILKFIVVPPTDLQRRRPKLVRQTTLTGLYEEEIQCSSNVVGITILSLFQIILFFANSTYRTESDIGILNKAFAFDPCHRKQVYRYISYIFVHADLVHLFGNIVVQILIGIPLEMVHSWRCIVIYVTGAFGGSLTSSVFDRGSRLVGGSGGVFAFFTAHIAAAILNWRERIHPVYYVLFFGVIVGVEIVVVSAEVIHSAITQTHEESQVSYATHLGGAVVGFLFGLNILRNMRVTKNETIFWYASFGVLTVLLLVFIILDVCLPLPSSINCNRSVIKSHSIGGLVNSTIL